MFHKTGEVLQIKIWMLKEKGRENPKYELTGRKKLNCHLKKARSD